MRASFFTIFFSFFSEITFELMHSSQLLVLKFEFFVPKTDSNKKILLKMEKIHHVKPYKIMYSISL